MSVTNTRITTRLDFEADGKFFDYLYLPHSVHESAYGRIIIPIVSIKNGAGPTLLLMAGNHGDEYEGQIALTKLVKTLKPSDINGRIIVLPMANYPAARAGRRTSPVDDGNLNRSFPGDPAGSPTEQIAYFIEHNLMPMADCIVDLHSGGSTIAYLPSVVIVGGPETEGFDARLALAQAFGGPNCLIFRTERAVTHLGSGVPGAALRQNRTMIAVELGYGGTTHAEYLHNCEKGARNVLMYTGILNGARQKPDEMRILYSDAEECFIYAFDDGLFEPACALGDKVEEGDIAGWIHHPDIPCREPTEYRFERSGIVINMRFPTKSWRGDMLFRLADTAAP